VATDRFAFWITNPSMAMYQAFNDWCSSSDTNPRLAFEAESSYQSIQIWRIDPYEFCPTQTNGVRRCPEDQSATFRTLPGFVSGDHSSQTCFQRFYVVAPTITYVNEYNIAVTVLETSFKNIQVDTLRPRNASDARLARLTAAREGFLILFHTLALQTILNRVKVDLARLKHLLLVILHLVVLENLGVHTVQHRHARRPAANKRPDLAHTLLVCGLVAPMPNRNVQNLIAVRAHETSRDEPTELLLRAGHAVRKQLEMVVVE
jgi:hypothetical protein